MNSVQSFNFNSNEVRSILIDNQPCFVGKDVAEVLGYSNPQKAIRDHVDDEDRTVNHRKKFTNSLKSSVSKTIIH